MPEGFRLEHKDIISAKRPENISPAIRERTHAGFFEGLVKEALQNYADAEKSGTKKVSPVGNIEFFFKKSWDKFAEPIVEYEDLLADIMTKKWESNGAKSRALKELNEHRARGVAGIKVIAPDFEKSDPKEKTKTLAKIYEGYALFINENEEKFRKLAEEVGKGFGYVVSSFLGTRDDAYLRESVERRLARNKRKKERLSDESEQSGTDS